MQSQENFSYENGLSKLFFPDIHADFKAHTSIIERITFLNNSLENPA